MSRLDWDRAARRDMATEAIAHDRAARRLQAQAERGSRPATDKQLDYVYRLTKKAGVPFVKPVSQAAASSMIEALAPNRQDRRAREAQRTQAELKADYLRRRQARSA